MAEVCPTSELRGNVGVRDRYQPVDQLGRQSGIGSEPAQDMVHRGHPAGAVTERLVDFDVNELMAAPEHVLGGTRRNLPTAALSHTCEDPVGVSGGVLADNAGSTRQWLRMSTPTSSKLGARGTALPTGTHGQLLQDSLNNDGDLRI
nr:hypothetical protein OG781_11385 [Streptomyces sp. NBC_00830]